jgi:hypothetical protein
MTIKTLWMWLDRNVKYLLSLEKTKLLNLVEKFRQKSNIATKDTTDKLISTFFFIFFKTFKTTNIQFRNIFHLRYLDNLIIPKAQKGIIKIFIMV